MPQNQWRWILILLGGLALAAGAPAAEEDENESAAGVDQEARAELLKGDWHGKIRTVIDPLLGRPTPENLRELAAFIPDLETDLARYTLWRSAAIADDAGAIILLSGGMRHKHPSVRRDAVDLLAARGPQARTALSSLLQRETEPGVLREAVLALGQLPGNEGIEALIDFANDRSAPANARALALKLLNRETGQKFGSDAFGWKQWWNKNRDTFKRAE